MPEFYEHLTLENQRKNGVPTNIVVDSDLAMAFEYNAARPSSNLQEVLATIDGQNDYANWHWLALLESGSFAYLTGGCDYTGWDCQSNLEIFEASTLDECLRLVPESHREQLREQLPSRARSSDEEARRTATDERSER